MAYAFFANSGLASLSSFGFGKAAAVVEVETSQDSNSESSSSTSILNNSTSILKDSPPAAAGILDGNNNNNPLISTSLSNSPPTSVLIKCNDCGGDLSLDQLGSHLCINPTTIPSSSSLPLQEIIIQESLSVPLPLPLPLQQTKESPLPLQTKESLPLPTKQESSDKDADKDSDNQPQPTPPRSQIHFLEKYAQLVPSQNISRTFQISSSSSRPSSSLSQNRLSSSSDSINDDLLSSSNKSQLVKLNSLLTPPTSPDSNPFQQLTLATTTTTPTTLHPLFNSSSTKPPSTTRLDQLLATDLNSLLVDLTPPPHHSKSSSSRSKSSRNSNQTPSSSNKNNNNNNNNGQLEDLMGDLMHEMSRKAKQSTHQLKQKKALSSTSASSTTTTTTTPSSNLALRKNSSNLIDSTQITPRFPPTTTTTTTSSSSPILPDSPGIRPSDSISQLGFNPPSPPSSLLLFSSSSSSNPKYPHDRCQRCGKRTDPRHAQIRQSSINSDTPPNLFCRSCYAQLYLPKCRKCLRPIEKAAVTDRVGKVLGKYHPECFNCFQCSAIFPDGDFYVWDRQPVCGKHYHRLAGTVCANQSCQQGIEGPCVSLSLDPSPSDNPSLVYSPLQLRRLYHPEHFTCTRQGCPNSLEEFHFVINGRPWCEHHARQQHAQKPPPSTDPSRPSNNPLPFSSPSRNNPRPPQQPSPPTRPSNQNTFMERRRTIIQNVRKR